MTQPVEYVLGQSHREARSKIGVDRTVAVCLVNLGHELPESHDPHSHKSTGTVAELYLSNARGCESCGKCPSARARARSVTVPPKPPPPAPSPIRRRLSTASQTYPVAAAWPGSGSLSRP